MQCQNKYKFLSQYLYHHFEVTLFCQSSAPTDVFAQYIITNKAKKINILSHIFANKTEKHNILWMFLVYPYSLYSLYLVHFISQYYSKNIPQNIYSGNISSVTRLIFTYQYFHFFSDLAFLSLVVKRRLSPDCSKFLEEFTECSFLGQVSALVTIQCIKRSQTIVGSVRTSSKKFQLLYGYNIINNSKSK